MSSNINSTVIQDVNIMINNANNKFFQSITSGWTIYEFFLNILFIFLTLIISTLIYWDTINKRVAKTSRCKKQNDLYDKLKGIFTLNVKDKSGDKLFNINYDFDKKIESIECACDNGNLSNTFKDIPIKILKTNENTYSKELFCKCDKLYEYKQDDTILEGNPGLIRYMKNRENDDFFNLVKYTR